MVLAVRPVRNDSPALVSKLKPALLLSVVNDSEERSLAPLLMVIRGARVVGAA